jgi:pyruvate/2-oxoglutarate dehydrogenase complex dihydrolipoamide acyltransferase (E2) component
MARIAVEMPNLGHDIKQGKIIEWVKKIGDVIERGDVIAEVETEKVTMEVEAFDSGVLVQIVHAVDSEVETGEVIAYLESD